VVWHFHSAIHPPGTEADTWIDILLGTILLAIVPFAMAAYGGHIAAESISDSKRQRKVKLIFWSVFAVGVVLAFVQQYRSVTQDSVSKAKTAKVEGAILGQLQNLHEQGKVLTPEQIEAKRRENIMAMLQGQYILQHDTVSAGIIEGTEPLPTDWVNAQLKGLKEAWTVTEPPKPAAAPAPANTYITWSGMPSFGRVKLGGDAHLQVGDLLGFNIDFKNNGPNAVMVKSQCQSLFVEPDDSVETEQRVIAEFKQFCDNWRKVQPQSQLTMGPGQALFVTAFAPDQPQTSSTYPRPIRHVTQEDINKLKNAQEFGFVVAEINYIDSGKLRHLHLCTWLQPPADPPGVWHLCGVFN
jgi:hypothetical protein